MTQKRWKKAEQKLASLFGTTRRPLSGSNSKSGGQDDGMHDRIYLESKSGNYIPLFTLFKDTRRKAIQENKVPVIGLRETGGQGALLVIHQDDFEEVYREWQRARGFHVMLQSLSPPKKLPPVPKRPTRTVLVFQGEEYELTPTKPRTKLDD